MSSDSVDQVELPVWLGGCEKWVTGLTKRTTCDDVIYALMAHEGNPNVELDIQSYAIYERWRDVERPLRGRTKVLKVWRAWGAERHKVKLYVRKVGDMLDTSCEISRSKKNHRRQSIKEKDRKSKDHKGKAHVSSAPPGDRNSKNVTDSQKAASEDKYKAKAFHQLVQSIIEQEKHIQDQLSRIKETDVQIENYETKMHLLRIKENGLNYVQEAYLRDKSDESSGGEELFPAIKANDLETYAHICDNIIELEERIASETSRVQDLSMRIQEESCLEAPSFSGAKFSTPQKNGQDFLPNSSMSTIDMNDATLTEDNLVKELETMKENIKRYASLANAQQKRIDLVNETVGECEWQLQRKEILVQSLLSELSTLEEEDETLCKEDEGLEGDEEADDGIWDDNPTVDLIEPPMVVEKTLKTDSVDYSQQHNKPQSVKHRNQSYPQVQYSYASHQNSDTGHNSTDQSRHSDMLVEYPSSPPKPLPRHRTSSDNGIPHQPVIRRQVEPPQQSTAMRSRSNPLHEMFRNNPLPDYQKPVVTVQSSGNTLVPPPLHSILRNRDESRSNSVSSRDSGHGSPDSLKDSGVYVHFNLDPPHPDKTPPRPPPRKFDPRRMSMPDMTRLTERLAELPPQYPGYETPRVSKDMEFYVSKSYYNRDVHSQKLASDNESNSDTGLSSLHSDESAPILETLV